MLTISIHFLLFWWFWKWLRKRCSSSVYMHKKKNRHHIHNDNQYSQATKRFLFVAQKWLLRSELTHPHQQTNRPASPPTTDHWGEGGAASRQAEGRGEEGVQMDKGLGTSFNSTLLWKLQLRLSRLAPRSSPSDLPVCHTNCTYWPPTLEESRWAQGWDSCFVVPPQPCDAGLTMCAHVSLIC